MGAVVLNQMPQDKRKDPMGVDVAPALVDCRNTAAVSVTDEAGMSLGGEDHPLAVVHPRLNGLGTQGLCIRLVRTVDLNRLHAERAQHSGKIPSSRAIHGVIHQLQTGLGNRLSIDIRKKAFEIWRDDILLDKGAARLGSLKRNGLLQRVNHIGGARAAIGHTDLNTQIIA